MRCVLLVLAASLTLLAQPPLEQAWQLASEGRRTDAIELLRKLIVQSPNNADERLLLGSLLMEAGEKEQSIEQLETAVRLRPDSEAENALGEAYLRFGNTGGARKAFEKAVALKPDSGIAQSNLGLVLLTAGNGSAAAPHLDRAIQLLGQNDDAADALFLRAKVFAAEGNLPLAERDLKRAVSIRPKFAEAWSDLGQTRRLMLDDAGALTAYEQAVSANPDDGVAQYRLGSEYLRQGQPHLAVPHLQTAARLNPTDQSTLNALQIALRKDGDLAGANAVRRTLADLLVKKDEVDQNRLAAVRLNNEGAVLDKAGNLPAAAENYRQASRLYPEHSGIHFNYGLALLKMGKWKEGLDELHEALSKDPGNGTIQKALDDALKQAPK